MAAIQTWNPLIVNETYVPAAITTSEGYIDIVTTPLGVTKMVPGRPEIIIQMRSDQNWIYLSTTGGNAFPIAANEVFNIRIMDPAQVTHVYVKAATTSGTIYGMRIV